MALLIESKKQIVAEVTEIASTAFAAVVADYQGLTVEQLTALRVEARLKAAAFDGKLYQGEEIGVIANLPNQEKALTMLASVLQAPISKLGRLLTALQEKNEAPEVAEVTEVTEA